jgi:hypothetical protein
MIQSHFATAYRTAPGHLYTLVSQPYALHFCPGCLCLQVALAGSVLEMMEACHSKQAWDYTTHFRASAGLAGDTKGRVCSGQHHGTIATC